MLHRALHINVAISQSQWYVARFFSCDTLLNTVGELRSGVTGFATIYATGSYRLTGSQWWKGWDQSSSEKRVNMTYHWLMYIIICLWSIIEFCRTFRWDIATKKRQIVTFEVKNLENNRNKSIILTKIHDSDGCVVVGICPYSYLAYIVRSPMLPLISEWYSYIIGAKMFRVRNY